MSLVSQYMNPDLVYVRAGDRVEIALRFLLDFGLTTVPVLDEDHCPVGVVSLRDLVDHKTPRPHLATDVKTITEGATIETAAQMLARDNIHHLIVVDGTGVAVGMLSSLDIVRALAGLPPHHPRSTQQFSPHTDRDIQSEFER